MKRVEIFKTDENKTVKPENISAVQRAIAEMKFICEQICLLKDKSKGTFTKKLQILREKLAAHDQALKIVSNQFEETKNEHSLLVGS